MAEQSVLAVCAHPDDIEFNMAGTLIRLAEHGFVPHMMNLSHSNLDSNEMEEDEVRRMRRREAEASAALIGATYHPPIVDDLMIFYEDRLLRKMSAAVREVRPTIVLLPSPNDYMEDHTNTARLVVTACFSRAMKHYVSDPPRMATDQDIYLYHAQPHLNHDGMRQRVVPELFINIDGVIEQKKQMLSCHQSQIQWLDETQGLADCVETMLTSSAEVARMSGQESWRFAEGWRRHSHVGFSSTDHDLLSHVLAEFTASV
jgi:LmbE family N-acetylglucosaminyl deacetylase